MTGRVSFVGAGPGAADLITLRGAKRLAEADIVVWAASLVDPECVREHAQPEAELVDSSLITHEDVLEIYRRAAREQLKVARVHSGDPSLWGAVQEQYDSCQRLGLEVEIVPGVSAFSAAAAIAGRELTVPEVAQSVILTRLEGGKTPMPDGEHIRDFAKHGTTMAIFLSAARSGQLVDELRAGGYDDDTPVIIAYKATWPDELILHTTIGELTETVKQHKLWRHTLFLVGKALKAGGTRSHLYHAGHFHTYRKADPAARRALRTDGTGPLPESAPEPEAAAGQQQKKNWSLHSSRAGRVAARVTPGQPTSAAAWSAVRGWQETARTAGRPGRQRPLRAVPSDQEAFDLAENDTPATPVVPVQPQPEIEAVVADASAEQAEQVRSVGSAAHGGSAEQGGPVGSVGQVGLAGSAEQVGSAEQGGSVDQARQAESAAAAGQVGSVGQAESVEPPRAEAKAKPVRARKTAARRTRKKPAGTTRGKPQPPSE